MAVGPGRTPTLIAIWSVASYLTGTDCQRGHASHELDLQLRQTYDQLALLPT